MATTGIITASAPPRKMADWRQDAIETARLAWPMALTQLGQIAMMVTDLALIGRLGDDAVAAVGLTIPLEFLMIAGWVGASTGLTSGLSRAMGAGHDAKVEQYVANRITVLGRVRAPGVLRFEKNPTLLEVIARAGGFRLADGFISPIDLVAIGLVTAEEAKELAEMEKAGAPA